MRHPILLALILLAPAALPAKAQASEPPAPTRFVVQLTDEERAYVLAEMRQFLRATQSILESTLANDFAGAARRAREVGTRAPDPMRATIQPKLPASFKELAGRTHQSFDKLAAEATFGDRDATLGLLAQTLRNCVACHGAFAFSGGSPGTAALSRSTLKPGGPD